MPAGTGPAVAEAAEPEAGNGARAPFSETLRRIATADAGGRVSVAEIVQALHDRAFGAVLLVFAAPNILPVTLPGTSPVTSLPIMWVGAQLLLGLHELRLPTLLARRSFARADLLAVVARLGPWLARAERLTRPRLPVLVGGPAERLVGLAAIVLGIVLFLPIPLGNIPPGIAVACMGLGLMERDGGWVAAGLGAGLLSLAIVAAVLRGALELVLIGLRGLAGL
jgi:hypothetical protein